MRSRDIQYESLVQCTKLSKKEQNRLVNWFSRQNTLVKIDIFLEQKNQFFKLKNKYNEQQQVIPLAAFLLAIQHFYSLLDSKNSKNKQADLSTIMNPKN